MKKKPKILKIVLIFILIIILFIIGFSLYFINDNNHEQNKDIVALYVGNQTNPEEKKYIIKTKDYDIIGIKEEIVYKTTKQASLGYSNYEAIKEYENNDIEIKQQGKKVVAKIPINYFKEKIGYDETDNVTYINENNEEKQIANMEVIKELLRQQGYIIQ